MLMKSPTPTPLACTECDGTGSATAWSRWDCRCCDGLGVLECHWCNRAAVDRNADHEPMCADCLDGWLDEARASRRAIVETVMRQFDEVMANLRGDK